MRDLVRFLFAMLKIGCIGFGGGSSLIPVMEREFVGEGKLDTKENFDKDILVASLTPGALPVELAASLGARNFGGIGMILGAVAMALPGAVATILLLTCLTPLRARIGLVMNVLTIFVSAYIIWQIVGYIRKVCRQSKEFSTVFYRRAVLVMIGVFLLSCEKNLYSLLGIERAPVFGFSTFRILLAAFIGIIVINVYRGLRKSKRPSFSRLKDIGKINCRDVFIWIVFLVILFLPAFFFALFHGAAGKAVNAPVDYLMFFGRGCLSALMSFGGGDAYLAVADGLFVETSMISPTVFYNDIVAVANILPGSILCKILTAVGYCYGAAVTESVIGGITFALGGFAASVAVSCMVFALIYHLYEQLSDFRSMQTISHYIGPIISGLLGTVALALLVLCKNVLV